MHLVVQAHAVENLAQVAIGRGILGRLRATRSAVLAIGTGLSVGQVALGRAVLGTFSVHTAVPVRVQGTVEESTTNNNLSDE